MPPDGSKPLAHFEALYARNPDPWGYASSPYEQAKYEATVEALPRRHYRRGLDVGCSVGILTGCLAARCDDLLAIEPVLAALEQARARNAGQPHVRFAQAAVPDGWPPGRFDLVVVSEVLDYLGEGDLARLAGKIADALEPAGDLVLVHWVGKKGAVSNGRESTDRLVAVAGDALQPIHARRNADYRLDVYRRS